MNLHVLSERACGPGEASHTSPCPAPPAGLALGPGGILGGQGLHLWDDEMQRRLREVVGMRDVSHY